MATRLTPLGIVTKWLVAPAACLALGFFIIGPVLGQNARKHREDTNQSLPKKSPDVQVNSTKIAATHEPTVTVGVRPASNNDSAVDEEEKPKPVRKKRTVRKRKTTEEVTETSTVTPDEPEDPIPDPASNPGGAGDESTNG